VNIKRKIINRLHTFKKKITTEIMHVIHLLNYHCKENLNFTLFTFPFSTYSVLFLCSVLQSSTLKMGFV